MIMTAIINTPPTRLPSIRITPPQPEPEEWIPAVYLRSSPDDEPDDYRDMTMDDLRVLLAGFPADQLDELLPRSESVGDSSSIVKALADLRIDFANLADMTRLEPAQYDDAVRRLNIHRQFAKLIKDELPNWRADSSADRSRLFDAFEKLESDDVGPAHVEVDPASALKAEIFQLKVDKAALINTIRHAYKRGTPIPMNMSNRLWDELALDKT
jgi:hypothetical protein